MSLSEKREVRLEARRRGSTRRAFPPETRLSADPVPPRLPLLSLLPVNPASLPDPVQTAVLWRPASPGRLYWDQLFLPRACRHSAERVLVPPWPLATGPDLSTFPPVWVPAFFDLSESWLAPPTSSAALNPEGPCFLGTYLLGGPCGLSRMTVLCAHLHTHTPTHARVRDLALLQ